MTKRSLEDLKHTGRPRPNLGMGGPRGDLYALPPKSPAKFVTAEILHTGLLPADCKHMTDISEPSSSQLCFSESTGLVYKAPIQTYEDVLINEFDILSRLVPHVNIVELAPEQHQDNLRRPRFFAMERLEQDLSRQLHRDAPTEAFVWDVLEDVARGLQHIHAQGYVHCDIRLMNLLLSKAGRVKIADFGTAVKTGEPVRGVRNNWWIKIAQPGSTPDMPVAATPELDMFCLGLAALQLVSRNFDLRHVLADDSLQYTPENVKPLLQRVEDQKLADAIRRLLIKEPSERLKPDELLALAAQRGRCSPQ